MYRRYPDVVEATEATGTDSLAELLDGELAFSATTAQQLSNHLPMALVALHRLGATDARLVEFASLYRDRLAPIPDADTVATFDGWLAARGRRGSYGAVRTYLDASIVDDGVDAVVRRCVAHLADGISGAAFHGLIRLAYALESRSDARVAAGLAYLTEVYQSLGHRGQSEPWTDDPLLALRRLSDVEVLQRLARSGNIGQRMRQVAAHPSFAGVVDWLAVSRETPARLTSAAAALFAATDDFTALHAVTASHAVHVISPFVEDTNALSAWRFQAIAAAYVTIGAPRLLSPAAGLGPWLDAPVPWDVIARAAVASDDEHVVKLAYSARELCSVSGDELLHAAAARHSGVAAGTRDCS